MSASSPAPCIQLPAACPSHTKDLQISENMGCGTAPGFHFCSSIYLEWSSLNLLLDLQIPTYLWYNGSRISSSVMIPNLLHFFLWLHLPPICIYFDDGTYNSAYSIHWYVCHSFEGTETPWQWPFRINEWTYELHNKEPKFVSKLNVQLKNWLCHLSFDDVHLIKSFKDHKQNETTWSFPCEWAQSSLTNKY